MRLPSLQVVLDLEAFHAHLEKLVKGREALTYAEFIEQALYHPEFGYYTRRDQKRVGHDGQADFYTAESLGDVFAELLVQAAVSMVPGGDLSQWEFLEVGAEEGRSVTTVARRIFRDARVLDPFEAPPTTHPVVVFCNEVLDAQPFNRLVFEGGRWMERGVKIQQGRLVEVRLDNSSPALQELREVLPKTAQEGYQLDISLGAERWLDWLCKVPWRGVLIAFDYGLDWQDLIERRPAGTARTYHRQTMGTDLLERPGRQDITCHVCWDRLEVVLRDHGFNSVHLQRQESFFVTRGQAAIERIMEAGSVKQQSTLRELIHPTRMGAAFQVLSGSRCSGR